MMNCPPEFIVFKPHPSNGFRWVIEIIDPPSQGVYETESYGSCTERKTLNDRIAILMRKWEEKLLNED